MPPTGRRATGRRATDRRATGRRATGRRATGRRATGRRATGRRATGMPPTGADVLASGVFAVVSQYLDAESNARLSRACRSLHSLLVHDDGSWQTELKVPCFSMGDPSLWRDEFGRRLPPGGRPARVMSLSTRVLPRIHFPSLKKLEFRMGAGQDVAYTNSASDTRDSFLRLAIGLGEAANLEELHLDAGLVIPHESFNSAMIYEAFAKNLARCKNLKKLKVTNYLVRNSLSYYSAGLLRALVPAVDQAESMLEEVTLQIGNKPAVETATRAQREAAYELWLAILRLPNLRDLNLQLDLISYPLYNEIFNAASHIDKSVLCSSPDRALSSASAIDRFTLRCKLYKVPEGTATLLPALLSLAPTLALLGQGDNVPPASWDPTAIGVLGDLFSDSPTMSRVSLHFDGYKCPGKCLKYLLDHMMETGEEFPDNLIHVSGQGCTDDHRSEHEEEQERYHGGWQRDLVPGEGACDPLLGHERPGERGAEWSVRYNFCSL